MTRLLAVNGSYRENGAIDQAVKLAVETASEVGAAIEVIPYCLKKSKSGYSP